MKNVKNTIYLFIARCKILPISRIVTRGSFCENRQL